MFLGVFFYVCVCWGGGVLIQWGGDPEADPDYTGGMIYNVSLRNTSESLPGGAE